MIDTCVSISVLVSLSMSEVVIMPLIIGIFRLQSYIGDLLRDDGWWFVKVYSSSADLRLGGKDV